MSSFSGTLYHGSNAVFTKFDQSKARIANDFFGGGVAYFTDSLQIGIQYAKSMSKGRGVPVLYTCKVSIRNLFNTEADYTGPELQKLLPTNIEGFARGAGLLKYGTDSSKVIVDLKLGKTTLNGKDVFKGLSNGMTATANAREHLRRLGYDGLMYAGGTITGSVPHAVYLPYSASSITIEDGVLVDFMKNKMAA